MSQMRKPSECGSTKPPLSVKSAQPPFPHKMKVRRKKQPAAQWDENFVSAQMPAYNASNDKYLQGYVEQMRRDKAFSKYLIQEHMRGPPGKARRVPSNEHRSVQHMKEAIQIYSYADKQTRPLVSATRDSQKNNQSVSIRAHQMQEVPSLKNVGRGRIQSQQRQRFGSSRPQQQNAQGLAIKPQYGMNDPRSKNVTEDEKHRLVVDLRSQWQIWGIPHFHRNKFSELLQELPSQLLVGVVSQEIQELQRENSNVQLLMRAVNAREQCLGEVLRYSEGQLKEKVRELGGDPKMHQLPKELLQEIKSLLDNLRVLSIYVIERLTAWREQFLYLASMQSLHQGKLRKKSSSQKHMIPFFFSDGQNYVLKMKHDTAEFCRLELRRIFNFNEVGVGKSDPFLLIPSLQSQHQQMQGHGVRAMLKGKQQEQKLLLHIPEYLVPKIKACEEVFLEEVNREATYKQQAMDSSCHSSIQTSHFSPQKGVELAEKEEVKEMGATMVKRNEEKLREEERMPKPEDMQFEIVGVNMKESQFPEYFEQYVAGIDTNLANSYEDSSSLLKSQENGYHRHYLHLSYQGRILGLVLFNVDHTIPNEQRAFIRHLSVTQDLGYLSRAVQQAVAYIFQRVSCSNIRVQVCHIKQEDGRFSAEPHVKEAYASAGFKWKALANDPETGKRAQIMQLNNPNCSLKELFQEPITIKAALGVGIRRAEERKGEDNGVGVGVGENCGLLMAALMTCKEEFELGKEHKFGKLNQTSREEVRTQLEIVDQLPVNLKFPATRSVLSEDKEECLELLQSQNLKLEYSPDNEIYVASVLSLVARLPPFDFLALFGCSYLRLKSDSIIRASCSKFPHVSSVFIIPTDDDKWKLAIILLDEEEVPQQKVGASLGVHTQQILRSAEEVQAEREQVNELYFPAFEIKSMGSCQQYNGVRLFEDAVVREHSLVQEIAILSGQDQELGLVLERGRKSFIVEQPFIFALMDAELEDLVMNLPLVATLVEKKAWIRAK